MAGDEIYIARFGVWVARALGASGEFATDLDTDGLGVRMPAAVAAHPAVKAAGAVVGDAAGLVTQAADALDGAITSGDEGELFVALSKLAEGLYEFFDAAGALVAQIEARAGTISDAAERQAVQAFVVRMARAIVDYLVISLLELSRPRLVFLLKLLGLIDWEVVEPDPADPLSRQHVKKALRLERAPDLFTDPAGHFGNAFGWGTASFDPMAFFRTAAGFFPENATLDIGAVGGDAFIERRPFRWSRDSSVNPPGLMLDVTAALSQAISGRAEFSPEWGAALEATLAVESGLIARVRPPGVVTVEPKAGAVSGELEVKVDRNESARPFTIIGGNSLVSLSAEDVGVGAGVVVGAGTATGVSVEPMLFAAMTGLVLRLGSEGADSFLGSVLADADIAGRFDIGLEWRLSEGLVVRAAGGMEIAIPMHQSLGFVDLETLYVMLRVNADASFTLETSVAITGNLGPLSASVERIGAQLDIAIVEGADATFGPLALGLGFKPPTGVGLALDAGVVRGGGFVSLDYEKGEYAGALELVFAEFLALKAIGLITTKMPDGSEGFSLLIIVTAEFGTPLQLGFGFTLVGVGGLLGLNRTMKLDELAQGVRSGSIDNIMFPTNVIANAPQIVSDMRRYFAPKSGTFLIGPMAKLGWGTPTLVTASIGVIVEVPPGNIAILGVLKVVLPDEDAALLVLQVSFIGAIEPDKQRIWFFASLFESRVLFITLGGDMGLLIAWGDAAEFVISVGGFHPAFQPPPMPFPVPRRVSLSILDESFARVRVSGYFAVTSNTAQFGAAIELFFGVSDFNIDGHLGFDALFRFSPFYFNITISASLSVKAFGIGLFSIRFRGELEGTSPWHIEGEGSISVLFWDIDVPFSHTWGEDASTTLPQIAALPILYAELSKRESWTALPPASAHPAVSLRPLEGSQELVLHPVGALRISQRAVPLDLDIDKVGNQPIADITRATLKVTASGLRRMDDVRESFATAQFRNIDEAAKLSAPSYEPQNAGIDLTVEGDEVATSHAVKRIVLQELIVIDSNYKEHLNRFFNGGLLLFLHLLNGNSAARSQLSWATQRAKLPFDDKIMAGTPGFVVAASADNTVAAGYQRFTSKAGAQDFLTRQVRANPAMRNALHVIPEAEASVA